MIKLRNQKLLTRTQTAYKRLMKYYKNDERKVIHTTIHNP